MFGLDLNTIQSVLRPAGREALPTPIAGDAFLSGGTWLFSEPQRHLRRLVDLGTFGWKPVEVTSAGIAVAATCTFAELDRFAAAASPLFGQCCRALWGSFKIWNTATIGGNLCLALPASPMAALAVALGATLTIWRADGTDRTLDAAGFIAGPQRTCLGPGDILRRIDFPAAALHQPHAFRAASLTEAGRSASLVIGRRNGPGLVLTVTAATRRPVRLAFGALPAASELAQALQTAVAAAGSWYDDIHGAPAWRAHMTHRLAEEVRQSLAAP
jgi:CO/xanthine dehydrogenase FAD-binding subunit